MTTGLRRRLTAALVTLFMVAGIALPAVAGWGPHCHHGPAAHGTALAQHVAEHHHHHGPGETGKTNAPCHCDHDALACGLCTMACCGVVLPSVTMTFIERRISTVPFTTAVRIFAGIDATRDPYPPRRTNA